MIRPRIRKQPGTGSRSLQVGAFSVVWWRGVRVERMLLLAPALQLGTARRGVKIRLGTGAGDGDPEIPRVISQIRKVQVGPVVVYIRRGMSSGWGCAG